MIISCSDWQTTGVHVNNYCYTLWNEQAVQRIEENIGVPVTVAELASLRPTLASWQVWDLLILKFGGENISCVMCVLNHFFLFFSFTLSWKTLCSLWVGITKMLKPHRKRKRTTKKKKAVLVFRNYQAEAKRFALAVVELVVSNSFFLIM